MDASTKDGNLVAPPPKRRWWRGELSPVNRRRWHNFKSNKRGYWSLCLFLTLFVISLFAELIANNKPLLIQYEGAYYTPFLKFYPETQFGGTLPTQPDYRDPYLAELIAEKKGWILWAPIRYSYENINYDLPVPAPSPPSWMMTKEKRCAPYDDGVKDPQCTVWNWNWLGTDGFGRDVMARVIYGFRLSALFGLILTFFSSIVGVTAGAVQGYFGGRVDLYFQRFVELWTSLPQLFVLLIFASLLPPGFWILLGILLLFSWASLVGVVRAEFLRGRNFDYIKAARALGLSDTKIMFKHLLPNAMVATITMVPFILSGSLVTLTALDYLGLGLPLGSPSLGELLKQGKNNLHAPWLVVTAFTVIALMLSLLVFVGEAVRDALDPRKTYV